MDDIFKYGSKIVIAILAVVVFFVLFASFSYSDKQDKQTLIIDRKEIKVRLSDIIVSKEGYMVQLQDIDSGVYYDNVLVSKVCPQEDKNKIGQLMEIEKIVLYRVKTDEKEEAFNGLYDYLCTKNKDNKNNENKMKNGDNPELFNNQKPVQE